MKLSIAMSALIVAVFAIAGTIIYNTPHSGPPPPVVVNRPEPAATTPARWSGVQTPTKEAEEMAPFATPESKPDVPLPTYDVVDRDTYDSPIKTQIVLHAVVSGTLTELGLRQLLQDLYDDANATRGFKYHGGKVTHVGIYLYTSREHFESGMGNWIAMLSKIGEGSQIDTQVKSAIIAQLGAKPEIRHGLSEAKRREVFQAIVRAEDRAYAEAERRWPLEPGLSLTAGQTFTLSELTALMPEREPDDPMAALQRMKKLPPGTRITVLRTEQVNGVAWYEVRASSAAGGAFGSGWINSLALMGQSTIDPSTQLSRQSEMKDQLIGQYRDEIAKRYDLTENQLQEISREAFRKNWPFPKRP